MHACDISYGARDFEVVHDWTYLVFEEFFVQGDVERDNQMPISMLCDRTTTTVPKVQPFFIKTFPLALFKELHKVMPGLGEAVD